MCFEYSDVPPPTKAGCVFPLGAPQEIATFTFCINNVPRAMMTSQNPEDQVCERWLFNCAAGSSDDGTYNKQKEIICKMAAGPTCSHYFEKSRAVAPRKAVLQRKSHTIYDSAVITVGDTAVVLAASVIGSLVLRRMLAWKCRRPRVVRHMVVQLPLPRPPVAVAERARATVVRAAPVNTDAEEPASGDALGVATAATAEATDHTASDTNVEAKATADTVLTESAAAAEQASEDRSHCWTSVTSATRGVQIDQVMAIGVDSLDGHIGSDGLEDFYTFCLDAHSLLSNFVMLQLVVRSDQSRAKGNCFLSC